MNISGQCFIISSLFSLFLHAKQAIKRASNCARELLSHFSLDLAALSSQLFLSSKFSTPFEWLYLQQVRWNLYATFYYFLIHLLSTATQILSKWQYLYLLYVYIYKYIDLYTYIFLCIHLYIYIFTYVSILYVYLYIRIHLSCTTQTCALGS
jgi:hypothetical protein